MGLEKWLNSEAHLLLLLKIQVQFPELMSGGSQQPVVTSSGSKVLLLPQWVRYLPTQSHNDVYKQARN